MTIRIAFLGSGSGGNCAFVEVGRERFLIDIGFSLKRVREGLEELGVAFEQLSHVLMTHPHRDHVRTAVLNRMAADGVRLLCSPEHEFDCCDQAAIERLDAEGLIEHYSESRFEMVPGVIVQPLRVRHDSPGTHGFVLDLRSGGSEARVVYVADCGTPYRALVEYLRDADLIALEFNHDVRMERESGRPAHLIQRVLGPDGHLSNEQAATLLADAKPAPRVPIVQLHLSRDCNTPGLALRSARRVLPRHAVHQTSQFELTPHLSLR